jgi:hypothetical protein
MAVHLCKWRPCLSDMEQILEPQSAQLFSTLLLAFRESSSRITETAAAASLPAFRISWTCSRATRSAFCSSLAITAVWSAFCSRAQYIAAVSALCATASRRASSSSAICRFYTYTEIMIRKILRHNKTIILCLDPTNTIQVCKSTSNRKINGQ